MREPAYYVLASLAGGPLHGNAIIRAAQDLSEGRIRLTTGALSGPASASASAVASPSFSLFTESPLNWALTWGFQWQWLAPAVPLTVLALWRLRRQAVL